jgi:hypothetical protein
MVTFTWLFTHVVPVMGMGRTRGRMVAFFPRIVAS